MTYYSANHAVIAGSDDLAQRILSHFVPLSQEFKTMGQRDNEHTKRAKPQRTNALRLLKFRDLDPEETARV